MRKTNIIFLILLGLMLDMFSSCWAEQKLGTQHASQSVNVSVIIPEIIKLNVDMLKMSNKLIVTKEAKIKGYIDVPNAMVIKLWCNTGDGAKVLAKIDNMQLQKTEDIQFKGKIMYKITGESQYKEIADDLLAIYESSKPENGTTVSIDMRYVLSNNTILGEYALNASFLVEPKPTSII